MKNKLILFDIDGILLESRGLGFSVKLVNKHYGFDITKIPPEKKNFEGMTWRKIQMELLRACGIDDPEKDEGFETMLYDDAPLIEILKTDSHRVKKIPGVEDLIKKLKDLGCLIGLLTGNSLNAAKHKLKVAGLWKYFKFGAYGTESLTRGDLVRIALVEAEKETGIKFDKDDVFIVGDTPLDIECAKYGGVKSIAVATGKYPLSDLQKESPDYAFENFSDINFILDAIEA